MAAVFVETLVPVEETLRPSGRSELHRFDPGGLEELQQRLRLRPAAGKGRFAP